MRTIVNQFMVGDVLNFTLSDDENKVYECVVVEGLGDEIIAAISLGNGDFEQIWLGFFLADPEWVENHLIRHYSAQSVLIEDKRQFVHIPIRVSPISMKTAYSQESRLHSNFDVVKICNPYFLTNEDLI